MQAVKQLREKVALFKMNTVCISIKSIFIIVYGTKSVVRLPYLLAVLNFYVLISQTKAKSTKYQQNPCNNEVMIVTTQGKDKHNDDSCEEEHFVLL